MNDLRLNQILYLMKNVVFNTRFIMDVIPVKKMSDYVRFYQIIIGFFCTKIQIII